MNAPIKHAVFLFSFLFAVYALVAQPANDNCANATTISPIAWEDPVSYNITATTQMQPHRLMHPGVRGRALPMMISGTPLQPRRPVLSFALPKQAKYPRGQPALGWHCIIQVALPTVVHFIATLVLVLTVGMLS